MGHSSTQNAASLLVPVISREKLMPSGQVMHEFEEGTLHSGKGGPIVTDRDQAIAIKMSEQRKEREKQARHKGQARAVQRISEGS